MRIRRFTMPIDFMSPGNPHGLRFVEGEAGEKPVAPQAAEQPAEDPKPEAPAREETDWKSEARKWEQRAKENSEARRRLTEIEEANKSEAEKAADRLRVAEERAQQAETEATRLRIATQFRLSADDAELLTGDESTMTRLAERLAKAEQERAEASGNTVGFHVDNTGRQASTTPDKDALARSLFG